MNNKKILDLLDRLNKALSGMDAPDTESRAKLTQLIHKINRKLGEVKETKHESSFADEITDAIIHFETKHPVIAETLEQLKMALYSIGL